MSADPRQDRARTFHPRPLRGRAAHRPPRHRRCLTAALLATGAVLATLVAGAQAARDDLVLVSRQSGAAGAAGDGNSLPASISLDGRLVAFFSDAKNLSDQDADATADVFVRDLQTNTTTLVSRAAGPVGAPGESDSLGGPISADGRLVAFRSVANNLSDQDADGTIDVFVRDMEANTTTLVSRAGGPAGAAGDGESGGESISADGRFVAFFSRATNLSDQDADATADVFVRDLQANTTTLVSGLGGAADGDSFGASISADGRLVAFNSRANNLSGEDVDGTVDVFVRDLQTSGITLVSRQAGQLGAAGDGDSVGHTISADGLFVAFDSRANNVSGEDVDGTRDVFVRDLRSSATTLVSRASGPAGPAGASDSSVGSISADGRFVTFASLANNLSDQDADGTLDVFVRDLQTGTTTLVSRAAGPVGAPGESDSLGGPISADGRLVAFRSAANNLSDQDADGTSDVFVREVLGSPAGGAVAAAPPGVAPARVPTRARCAGKRATLVGTARRDVLRGTARRDVIVALGGNDLVIGRGGPDLICLGAGQDRGVGGASADRIEGGSGNDRLLGGAGRDLLTGGAGRDLLLGGAGRDLLTGGAGRDLLLGGAGPDRLVGGAGRDECRGGAGTLCEPVGR